MKRKITQVLNMWQIIKLVITLGLLFVGVSQAVIRQPQCELLSKAASAKGLDQICGYNYTARFEHDKHFDSAVRAVRSMTSILKNCSEFVNTMICSLFVPRCSEEIPGPYLPCRGVCYDYASNCSDVIHSNGLQWTAAMCDILAESDDPKTTKGYRGRCFKPANFKDSGQVYNHPCAEVVIEPCKGIPGFTHTVVSKNLQRKYSHYIGKTIGNITTQGECGPLRQQIVCAENMPACFNGSAGFLCRDRCENFFDKCPTPFFYGKNMCMEFPEKEASSPRDSLICKQTHWPRSENWASDERPSTETKTTTTSGSEPQPGTLPGKGTYKHTEHNGKPTLKPPKTGSEPQPGTLPGKDNGKPTLKPPKTDETPLGIRGKRKDEGSSSKKVLTGSLVAGFLVLLIIGGILAFFIYKRKRNRQFDYQKQVLYSGQVADDEFKIDA